MALSGNMPGRKLGPDEEIELTDQQEDFLDWLTGDRPAGETQVAYAARLGVHEGTLTRWKKDRAFLRRWEERMRETHAHPEKLSKLLTVTYQRAESGDMKAVELYHRLLDKMTPEKVEHVTSEGVDKLSDEELDRLISEKVTAEKGRRLKAV